MALELHNLEAPKGQANKKKKRVGRGNASGSGNYSGRGMKGQKSRSGSSGLKVKGLRRRLLSIPKLRGFTSLKQPPETINLQDLQTYFEDKAIITPKVLVKAGLIDTPRYGVKILGEGNLSKAFTIKQCSLSASAKEKVEKAGGKIEA